MADAFPAWLLPALLCVLGLAAVVALTLILGADHMNPDGSGRPHWQRLALLPFLGLLILRLHEGFGGLRKKVTPTRRGR